VTLPPAVHFEWTMRIGFHGGGSYVEGKVLNDWGRPLYDVAVEAMFREWNDPEQITTTLPGQRNVFRSQVVGDTNSNWYLYAPSPQAGN
jgi:hypothetical protein